MKETESITNRISEDFEGVGEISDDRIEKRAKEIAVINSRPNGQYTDEDWEQAKRELLEPIVTDPTDTTADEVVENLDTWDEPLEAKGVQAPEVAPPDDARIPEQLVKEGVREAEHEQLYEAHEEDLKRQQEESKIAETPEDEASQG
jgi:hypothetical protein